MIQKPRLQKCWESFALQKSRRVGPAAAQKSWFGGWQLDPGFVPHVVVKVSAEMRFSPNGTTGYSHGREPVDRDKE
jgi:hypothetical protein